MTTLIFAAHGMSAPGMKDSVEMVLGPQERFHTVMLSQDEGIEHFRNVMTALVKKSKAEEGGDILILTDMPAGTPFNVSVQLSLEIPGIAVLSGTNLPMVLTALESDGESLEDITRQVIETGKDAIRPFIEAVTAEEDF